MVSFQEFVEHLGNLLSRIELVSVVQILIDLISFIPFQENEEGTDEMTAALLWTGIITNSKEKENVSRFFFFPSVWRVDPTLL